MTLVTQTIIRRILIVLVSAALPAVMWSLPMNPGVGMLLSLVGFFIATRDCSVAMAWRLGLLYGIVLYGISLSWLWEIFSSMSVLLWLMLGLFHGVIAGLTTWARRHVTSVMIFIPGSAALWTAIEYYRCEWFMLRFPWMTPGTSMGPLWLHSVLGVYGVSFMMVTLALLIVFTKRNAVKIFLSLLLFSLFLVRPFYHPKEERDEWKIPVLAIQRENCDFTSYLEDTRASDFRDGVILWPEYSTCSDIRATMVFQPEPLTGVEILRRIAEQRNVTFIVGAISPSGQEIPWNEAIVIDRRGEIGTHYKNRPVHFMKDGIPGKTQNPVMTQWGYVGSPICFDNDYTEVPRRFAHNGVEVFLVPSLDAEPWTRRQHLQHGELFRIRAVETGRWYVVCATSGLSQTIRPDGVCVQELPLMEDQIMETKAYRRQGKTPYVLWGWMFPWLCCAGAIVFLAFVIRSAGKNTVRLTATPKEG